VIPRSLLRDFERESLSLTVIPRVLMWVFFKPNCKVNFESKKIKVVARQHSFANDIIHENMFFLLIENYS
jgi:hypothetical protein